MAADISGTCGVCGRPGHRYGTTDDEHWFDATACVNGLLHDQAEARQRIEALLAEERRTMTPHDMQTAAAIEAYEQVLQILTT